MRRWAGMLVAGLIALGVGTPMVRADVSAFYGHDWVGTNEEFGHFQAIEVGQGSEQPHHIARATPYPSRLPVAHLSPYLADVEVYVIGLKADVPEDLDLVLVAPDGTAVKLLSDAGGGESQQASFTLSAKAQDRLPAGSGPDSWDGHQWLPTDVNTGLDDDVFPWPAPFTQTSTDMRSFIGSNPNGEWELYLTDDGDHGGGVTIWQLGLDFDTSDPQIASGLPNDGRLPLHAHYRADVQCHDGQTGIARCEALDGAIVDTSTLGERTFRVLAQDGSGRTVTQEFRYAVVDVEAPTVTLRAPTSGAAYALGQKVLADYDCADEADGSGVATCSGTVSKGSALDTTSLGQHGFTVRTSDHAGNERTVNVTYSVCAAPQLDVLPDPVGGPVHNANCGS